MPLGGVQDPGWRPGWCRVASLPLCPFSLAEPLVLVHCCVMEAQEESSNTRETWKMLLQQELLVSMEIDKGLKKTPDPSSSPGLPCTSTGPVEHCSTSSSRTEKPISPPLSSSAVLLPSFCFFLSLSPFLPSSTSSSPSFLLCFCYSSVPFSLCSPLLSGSPPFFPVSQHSWETWSPMS